MTKTERIVEICQAYESGYMAGRMNMAIDTNEYQHKTDQFYAWMLGHNTGIQLELMELDEILPN